MQPTASLHPPAEYANLRLPAWWAALRISNDSTGVILLLSGLWFLTAGLEYQTYLKLFFAPMSPHPISRLELLRPNPGQPKDIPGFLRMACWLWSTVAINQIFVLPRTIGGSLIYCLGQGAMMGLLLYGTVGVIIAALPAGWPLAAVLIDIAWGAAACALLAVVQKEMRHWLTTPLGFNKLEQRIINIIMVLPFVICALVLLLAAVLPAPTPATAAAAAAVAAPAAAG